MTERALSEHHIAEAVGAAREAGVSWSAIGGLLGTSGEAARKGYGGQHAKTASKEAAGLDQQVAAVPRPDPPSVIRLTQGCPGLSAVPTTR